LDFDNSTGNSTLELADDFSSSGSLNISGTVLTLTNDITLTSVQALNYVTLNLNLYTLTLGSLDSDLTVENAITIAASTEGILTGGADLYGIYYSKITGWTSQSQFKII